MANFNVNMHIRGMSLSVFLLVVLSVMSQNTDKRNSLKEYGVTSDSLTFFRGGYSSWQLVFVDEFEGDSLDKSVWMSEEPSAIKHKTYRGYENAKVEDGELRLYVTKESRNGSEWCAASVFTKEVLVPNSYVECRFRATQCTGVNNAFWLACRTNKGEAMSDRYEVDIVEVRQDRSGIGKGHLAWHDWKTMAYAVDSDGRKAHVAQGIHVDHSFDEYHVWGLWYGENEFIYYLDGKPVWNGKIHDKYPQQWQTGVGKLQNWFADEEQRAYGKYGQDDWNYLGGYNGDRMNIILSTLPWGNENTPLTEKADGTYMAVDYVKVYRPTALESGIPEFSVEHPKSDIELPCDCDLACDSVYYMSFEFVRTSAMPMKFNFVSTEGKDLGYFCLNPDNWSVGLCDKKASTSWSYPACEQPLMSVEIGKKYLAVIRFTVRKTEKDAISVIVYGENDIQTLEPYFYPNIDDKGNTSVTNGWTVNCKADISDSIRVVRMVGDWKILALKYGKTYKSVLSDVL